jgi:L-threonylcarbamoyladenylate synthase
MAQIGKDIEQAKAILDGGGLVAIPTETVYGLAGNALNQDIVAKIFRAKNRPSFDPLIVHTHSVDQLDQFVDKISEKAYSLAHKFWPGPLTLLLNKNAIVPDLTTSGLDTVACRVPQHELTLSLLALLDYPLAAPSANPFGYVSPTSAQHVNAQLGDQVDYILDGGESQVGIESTIVSLVKEQPMILRLGGLSVEHIEDLVGPVEVAMHSSSKPSAPGMLKSHYAPQKTIVLTNDVNLHDITDYSEFGAIVFQQTIQQIPQENQLVLSEKGDLDEAAKNLFKFLRELDSRDHIHTILTEYLPNEGLGRAINDRIKRATSKT